MTTSNEKSFFDLHITGLGYLNRIREVKPKKGAPFLACDIVALNGPSDDVSKVRFDTRVSGTEAQHLVRKCRQAVDDKKKVLIGFRLGDLWTDVFTYEKGERIGEQGVSLKARLLYISWIKVDGSMVYKAEPKSAASENEASERVATPVEQEAPAPETEETAVAPEESIEEQAPAMAESF
ncbi:STY4534 family ICE replication protein [Xanthomonas campestris pv. phormiicola]|nr:DUF3577 domain-containing protein [Xanthomonas campestris pv. phormiicola]UYC17447.1 STY4534 family ICE replication protein [Xanthomonas campestris pv. phormiicola]